MKYHLELPAGLVQLVHGAAALAQLVRQVLDLLGQVLVLPPGGVQVLQHLLVGGLDAEVIRAVVVAVGLAAGVRGILLSPPVQGHSF